MSAGISTVPAVLARLKEIFAAAVEEPTQVWAKRPNEDYELAENVFLGDVHGERRFVNTGTPTPHQREEDYSVEVEVEVYRGGTDGEGTEARTWQIVAAIEQAIANEPKLGFEGAFQWAIVGRFASRAVSGADGWKVTVTFDVQATARI